jgi:DNA invertase Pin-like site-specific DNA recombinase
MVMKNKTIAYLRVSTVEQDLEKNKADILTFANDRDFGKVKFVEEKVSGMKNWKDRKIKQVIDELNKGDRLIVPEFSRLGRSMLEIMEMLSILKKLYIIVRNIESRYFQQIASTKKERFKKVDSSKEIDRNSLYGSVNLKAVIDVFV